MEDYAIAIEETRRKVNMAIRVKNINEAVAYMKMAEKDARAAARAINMMAHCIGDSGEDS